MAQSVLATAWSEYGAWDARANELQAASDTWKRAALVSAGIAAVLASAASSVPATGNFQVVGKGLSLASALAAGLVPVLGKEMLVSGGEEKWVQARACAEAIKSECYRFAARIGNYASPNRDDALTTRCDELFAVATQANLTPKVSKRSSVSVEPMPPESMDAGWYVEHRLRDQMTYYSNRQQRHELAGRRLRHIALAASSAAAVFGVAGVSDQQTFAPWIGAFTTATTAVAAHGMLDRRQQLAASFGAMAVQLGRILARVDVMTLEALVTRTENLLRTEHAAWTALMLEAEPAPPGAEARKDLSSG